GASPDSPGAETTGKRSALTGGGRHFGGEIGFLLLNAFAKRVTHKAGDLDRTARLAFGFLGRLRDALLVVEDKRLIEQRLLLVESFQTRFDDLIDHILGLALLAKFVGENVLLALDYGPVDGGGIDRDRIGGRDMHRDLPAERHQFVRLARRFKRNEYADLAEPVADRIVHVISDHALADRQCGGA